MGIYGFWVIGGQWGWPFPVPALRCARMTGLLSAKPKEVPLLTGLLLIGRKQRWIRFRTRLRFRTERCLLGSCWAAGCQVAGTQGNEWQRAAEPTDECARATAHQTAPARPKSAYLLPNRRELFLSNQPHLAERLIITHPSSQNSTSQSPPRG